MQPIASLLLALNKPLTTPDVIQPVKPLYSQVQLVKPIETKAPDPVEPVEQVPVPFVDTYEAGNCTFFVSSVVHVPQDLGNANTWAYVAQKEGYQVSSVPKVGSVAQSSAGYYGHVALVIAVGDGQVLLREMNVEGLNVIDERWVPTYAYQYIYF